MNNYNIHSLVSSTPDCNAFQDPVEGGGGPEIGGKGIYSAQRCSSTSTAGKNRQNSSRGDCVAGQISKVWGNCNGLMVSDSSNLSPEEMKQRRDEVKLKLSKNPNPSQMDVLCAAAACAATRDVLVVQELVKVFSDLSLQDAQVREFIKSNSSTLSDKVKELCIAMFTAERYSINSEITREVFNIETTDKNFHKERVKISRLRIKWNDFNENAERGDGFGKGKNIQHKSSKNDVSQGVGSGYSRAFDEAQKATIHRLNEVNSNSCIVSPTKLREFIVKDRSELSTPEKEWCIKIFEDKEKFTISIIIQAIFKIDKQNNDFEKRRVQISRLRKKWNTFKKHGIMAEFGAPLTALIFNG